MRQSKPFSHYTNNNKNSFPSTDLITYKAVVYNKSLFAFEIINVVLSHLWCENSNSEHNLHSLEKKTNIEVYRCSSPFYWGPAILEI